MSKVFVACKLPNGHVIAVGDTAVTLEGPNNARIVTPEGFGLTAVDKALWDAWYKEHAAAKFAPLTAGLIFAHEKREDVEADSADREDVKSGFEGMPQEMQDGANLITEEEGAKKRRKESTGKQVK